MYKKLLLGLMLPLALFSAASLLSGATEMEKEVVVGLNVPLTGPYVLQGKDQLNAYALAKQEIERQGGILGRSIRYVIADSRSDPRISVENVRQFIAQGVDIVTGGSSSGVAVEVSKVCQENKKLFMTTLAYSNDLTGKEAHRYTFRETYNSWMAANALSRYLARNFPDKKYFYITADYNWGWTTRDSMKKFTRTESATDVLIPMGEPPGSSLYRNAIRKALDEQAEILVMSLFGRDMIAGLRECMNMGVKEKMQIVVPNLEMHMALGSHEHPASGVLGAVPWYWEIPKKYNFERGRKFVDDYSSRYGKPPCSGGATAYMNMMLYKWAVEKAGSFDPRKIITALEGHGFVGLKDEETIRDWDHQTIQSVYVVRGRGEDMKGAWDVFEVLDAYGGDLAPSRAENPVILEPLG